MKIMPKNLIFLSITKLLRDMTAKNVSSGKLHLLVNNLLHFNCLFSCVEGLVTLEIMEQPTL